MKVLQRIKLRKHLSADGLIGVIRLGFEKISDPFRSLKNIALADALMAAFAMFSLKSPSLLSFDQRRKDGNLPAIYKIRHVPCDSQMREILDPLEPESLRPVFKDVFGEIQRGKGLEKFVFLEGCYLLALDGTQYFTSEKLHCPLCMQKVDKKTGKVTYYHQMLGAALVHPDHKEVIPLCPEPIRKQDGQAKNDCERNAAKRFIEKFRKDHPYLRAIVIEDALSSNAPHLRMLEEYDLHYLLGVKEGDHAHLFAQVRQRLRADEVICFEKEDPQTGVIQTATIVPGVCLNESNQDLLVNFVAYSETDSETGKGNYFSWVTDLDVNEQNVWQIARGGRARWKIENETFNTLKNQGYHLEHNYGHGNQNLSIVFPMLMMLAFLVDQAQQLCCRLFQEIWQKLGSKRRFWEDMRSLFFHFEFSSMAALYEALLYGLEKVEPVLLGKEAPHASTVAIDSS